MFNKSQIEAISHEKGPAIVLAGPGSGKTTVITHRIRNLIEEYNVPPEKILVVTFTKAAAEHMQKQFLEIINPSFQEKVCNKNHLLMQEIFFDENYPLQQKTDCAQNYSLSRKTDFAPNYPVAFGTFHSIYYRILRSAYDYGTDCIISEYMKSEIIKEIVIRLQVDTVCMPELVCSLISEIGRCKSGMYEVKEYHPGCCTKEDFIKIFKAYNEALNAERKLDFEDILIKCYELLNGRDDVLKQWQETYEYILIDEFQDICRVQYEIIKLLALPENNIFIVGDDDQSIYGFRGASPEIMFQFEKDYPDAKQILLDKNYRSTSEIVRVTSNLISHNRHRFAKDIVSAKKDREITELRKSAKNDREVDELRKSAKEYRGVTERRRSDNQRGAALDIRQFANQGKELKYMCDKIRYYMQRGMNPSEIAILVRNNIQIPEIRSFLQTELFNVKYKKTDNDIYSGTVAKDIMAYIKAALSNQSAPLKENPSLIYVLNKPSRLISRQIALRDKMNLEGLRQIYSHNRDVSRNIEELQFHLQMITEMTPSAAVVYIKNGVGYENYLKQYAREHKLKLQGLLRQLEKLQAEAGKFTDMESWLAHIEDYKSNANKVSDNGINLITIHSAKGLEFRAVFVVDVNQGIIPSTRAVRERDYMEERRVFYVALTRASEFLNVYGVAERLGCEVEMSVFVQEMLEKG